MPCCDIKTTKECEDAGDISLAVLCGRFSAAHPCIKRSEIIDDERDGQRLNQCCGK